MSIQILTGKQKTITKILTMIDSPGKEFTEAKGKGLYVIQDSKNL